MVLARDGGVVLASIKFKGWMGLRASEGVSPTTLPTKPSDSGQEDKDALTRNFPGHHSPGSFSQ